MENKKLIDIERLTEIVENVLNLFELRKKRIISELELVKLIDFKMTLLNQYKLLKKEMEKEKHKFVDVYNVEKAIREVSNSIEFNELEIGMLIDELIDKIVRG